MPHCDETKSEIEAIMKRAFSPIELLLVDESAQHRGHQGAKERPGAGHFKLFMKSRSFDGLNQVKRHRLVYQELAHLMEERIHALSLNLRASDE